MGRRNRIFNDNGCIAVDIFGIVNCQGGAKRDF